jgi:hypothetical protein
MAMGKDIGDELVHLLNEEAIEYRIIKPGPGDGRLTLLIKNKFYDKFNHIMKSNKYRKLYHPYGKLYQYRFLYQMNEFQLFYKQKQFMEIFFELPCMSLSPYTWIPLDILIQNSIWTERFKIDDALCLDEMNHYIFTLTWVIFMKKTFDETDIIYFNEKKHLLDMELLIQKLNAIFFKYTPQLISMLKEEKYPAIRQHYIAYSNY